MSVTDGHSSETLSPEIISESLSKHATKNNTGWWVVAYTYHVYIDIIYICIILSICIYELVDLWALRLWPC